MICACITFVEIQSRRYLLGMRYVVDDYAKYHEGMLSAHNPLVGLAYGSSLTRADPNRFLNAKHAQSSAGIFESRGRARRKTGHRLSQPRPSHPLVKYQSGDRQWMKS